MKTILRFFTNKTKLLNTLYTLFLISIISQFINQLFFDKTNKPWYIGEFLINYQGGFVRRGLLGEILFFLTGHFQINIEWTVKIICLLSLLSVCIFFVKSFLERKYTLYLLPLCFFLGGAVLAPFWIRKDCLMVCFFIAMIWIFKQEKQSVIVRTILINVLAVFITLTHEVFAFFALPVLLLLYIHLYRAKGSCQSIMLAAISLLPFMAAFLFAVIMHGNQDTAQAIWDSWQHLAGNKPSEVNSDSAIGAIGWNSLRTFIFHMQTNFLTVDNGIVSFPIWLITFPMIYYTSTNALWIWRKNDENFTGKQKKVLSSVLIFQLLCLLPVLSVLSCDYIRITY